MGQKIHPYGFRVGITRPWMSRWYANSKKEFGEYLVEDQTIKKYLRKRLKNASVARIEIERSADEFRVIISTSQPGRVIGKKGAEIDKLKEELQTMVSSKRVMDVKIKEITEPDVDGQLVAMSIADQLARRGSFRRAMKRAAELARDGGVKGIKIQCAGRLGGAEIARVENYRWGSVPLHTLDADIDYGFAEAETTFGMIGCKVWLFKGELLTGKRAKQKQAEAAAAAGVGAPAGVETAGAAAAAAVAVATVESAATEDAKPAAEAAPEASGGAVDLGGEGKQE
ncbi:MAG: 30S ribosomal protein S3 [Planctomycetota bacterium]